MKSKQLSLLIATVMATNTVALANGMDELKLATPASRAALAGMVSKTDKETVQDLIMTYQEVQRLAASLRAVKNDNQSDKYLKFANEAHIVLVGISALALKSHIGQAEKSRYMLQLAAATALLNSVVRHYSEIKNLKPSEVGVFLNQFTYDMTQNKSLTPEMVEMADSLNQISSKLIEEKSQIDTIVNKLGGGSDWATAALIILSVAHYISPKIAKQGEEILKTMTQKFAAGSTAVANNSRVVGSSGLAAGVPDLIGVALGVDSAKSQEMISATLNNLDIASRKLQMQINAKKK